MPPTIMDVIKGSPILVVVLTVVLLGMALVAAVIWICLCIDICRGGGLDECRRVNASVRGQGGGRVHGGGGGGGCGGDGGGC